MKSKKPKVCDACLEEDELIWDNSRNEWLCALCIEDFNAKNELRKSELKQANESEQTELDKTNWNENDATDEE